MLVFRGVPFEKKISHFPLPMIIFQTSKVQVFWKPRSYVLFFFPEEFFRLELRKCIVYFFQARRKGGFGGKKALVKVGVGGFNSSHRIHVWYVPTFGSKLCQNIGKYTSSMDPMGFARHDG